VTFHVPPGSRDNIPVGDYNSVMSVDVNVHADVTTGVNTYDLIS
jgi:hypothetical protein